MFTVTAGSGLTLNFNARGSSAPDGVAEYVWQFNDAFGAQTIEQTTPAGTVHRQAGDVQRRRIGVPGAGAGPVSTQSLTVTG